MGESEQAREHFRRAGIELIKGFRRILKDQVDKQGAPPQKPKPIIL
jgi:hypothetical protein